MAQQIQKQVLEVTLTEDKSVKKVYVSEVTEKSIKVIVDEGHVRIFNRETGQERTQAKVKAQITDMDNLLEFVVMNGKLNDHHVWCWNGGWRPRLNSRGDVVNDKCPVLNMPWKPWFRQQEIIIVKL